MQPHGLLPQEISGKILGRVAESILFNQVWWNITLMGLMFNRCFLQRSMNWKILEWKGSRNDLEQASSQNLFKPQFIRAGNKKLWDNLNVNKERMFANYTIFMKKRIIKHRPFQWDKNPWTFGKLLRILDTLNGKDSTRDVNTIQSWYFIWKWDKRGNEVLLWQRERKETELVRRLWTRTKALEK